MSHIFVPRALLRAFFVATLVSVATLLSTASSFAALVSFSGTSADGHAVSGTADFTLNDVANTVTVKLTNTTTTTLDAGELFTGIDFSIGGLGTSMTSDTAIQRTVANNGTYADTLTPQNITWSLINLGSGNYQLNFNPDAKDSIIGPPTAGSYSGANGSITNSPGHQPFAAQMATFVLSVPSLAAGPQVHVSTFRYGTELQPATGKIVPEPTTWLTILAGTAIIALRRRR